MNEDPKKAILGVGNVLLSDEGVGVHAVRYFQKVPLPPGVVVFDGGTEGFGLMDFIVGLERLVVIDCVRGGQPPGTMYQFDVEDIHHNVDKYQTSIHQVGILEVLHMVDLVGPKPHTTVLGIEPASLAIGMELSDEVARRLPELAKRSLNLLDQPA